MFKPSIKFIYVDLHRRIRSDIAQSSSIIDLRSDRTRPNYDAKHIRISVHFLSRSRNLESRFGTGIRPSVAKEGVVTASNRVHAFLIRSKLREISNYEFQ